MIVAKSFKYFCQGQTTSDVLKDEAENIVYFK